MKTKTIYVKEESFVITKESLGKAILLAYKNGFDNGILFAKNPDSVTQSEQVLEEVFKILEDGMADVK